MTAFLPRIYFRFRETQPLRIFRQNICDSLLGEILVLMGNISNILTLTFVEKKLSLPSNKKREESGPPPGRDLTRKDSP